VPVMRPSPTRSLTARIYDASDPEQWAIVNTTMLVATHTRYIRPPTCSRTAGCIVAGGVGICCTTAPRETCYTRRFAPGTI